MSQSVIRRVKPGRAYGADGISGRLSVRPKPGMVSDPAPRVRPIDPDVVRSTVDCEVTGYSVDGRITGVTIIPANRVPRMLRTLALLSDRTVRAIVTWRGGTAEYDMSEVTP